MKLFLLAFIADIDFFFWRFDISCFPLTFHQAHFTSPNNFSSSTLHIFQQVLVQHTPLFLASFLFKHFIPGVTLAKTTES